MNFKWPIKCVNFNKDMAAMANGAYVNSSQLLRYGGNG